ncbi:MAG: HNH endonuclease [Myxococcota bacterium]
MIDVKRSLPAPASLAQRKTWGADDVREQLYNDFLHKCYLCENKLLGPGSIEVDHRKQRGQGGDKYDWNNLCAACHDCNIRRPKKWPDGGPLDPAGGDRVEQRLIQEMVTDEDGERVPAFRARSQDDRAASNTARELDHIHNDPKNLKASDLRNAIVRRSEKVAAHVLHYLDAQRAKPRDKQQLEWLEQRIAKMVSRRAPFTALIRSVVGRHLPQRLLD